MDTRILNTEKRICLQRMAFREETFNRNKPQYIAREQYAWPGGYALIAITDDGGTLCASCVKSNYRQIRESFPGDGWHIVGIDHTGNIDEPCYCDHCNQSIVDGANSKSQLFRLSVQAGRN